jgi:ribosomal protein L23
MAILNLKKKKTETVAAEAPKKTRKLSVVSEKTVKVRSVVGAPVGDFSGIIICPRITEKVTVLSDKGPGKVFMFEVSRKANKHNVSLAIQSLYKVKPVKVAILRVPPKKSLVRGRIAYGTTGRKAYVYFKKGDKIEIV